LFRSPAGGDCFRSADMQLPIPLKIFLIIAFGLILAVSYWFLATPRYLTFSDTARYADTARSVLAGEGFTNHHAYFSKSFVIQAVPPVGWEFTDSQFTIIGLSAFMKYLPPSDTTIFLAGLAAFTSCLVLIYLLGYKLHSPVVGFLAVILFATNPYILEYTVNATSELFFILEILLFFVIFISRLPKLLLIFPLVLMYYTRAQAPVFYLSALLFLMVDFIRLRPGLRSRSVMISAVLISVIGLVLFLASGYFIKNSTFLYLRHIGSSLMVTGVSPGNYLRGVNLSEADFNYRRLMIKIFYNLYNFLKQPERIAHPLVIFLFLLAPFQRSVLFRKSYLLTLFLVGLFLVFTSVTLPNARYIHPLLPLVFIFASASAVNLTSLLRPSASLAVPLLFLFIVSLPSLGHIYLDYRFRHTQLNYGRPPLTKVISDEFFRFIPPGQLTLTNLDSWAAWYHGLTTMWFPLSTSYLEPKNNKPQNVRFIALTTYKEQDGDFDLGEWKEILVNPQNPPFEYIAKNYELVSQFTIQSEQVFENYPVSGVILKLRQH